jgi:hypothetical protein
VSFDAVPDTWTSPDFRNHGLVRANMNDAIIVVATAFHDWNAPSRQASFYEESHAGASPFKPALLGALSAVRCLQCACPVTEKRRSLQATGT